MTTIDLSGDWRLVAPQQGSRPSPGSRGHAFGPPGSGKIPDPYLGTNELDVQWVGREDWMYERDLRRDQRAPGRGHSALSLTPWTRIADVFLNGKKVGSADNMFVRWRFDAKRYLKNRDEHAADPLHVRGEGGAAAAAKLPYPVPHTIYPVQSPHRNLVRKVQCHSGWDWGPCLMVAGIDGEHLPGCVVRCAHRLRVHRAEARAREVRRARVRRSARLPAPGTTS